ncbi:hypothetical protein PIB30_042057 [Stylosanthes scabra]|uniref:Late embryogenesis abundant protein LEA-2 subgroup domain-containing protein n=1 Tax=Stylosanthes scabra TaxID=79078 RepID=A0ABU6XF93_9FABA|nr:hypothetical protein [Stylosanthes scabra]
MGGVRMHTKSDSDVSIDQSTSSPPRSPRRPLYYVQSPSNHDVIDKMSYGSSPAASPQHHHHYYVCSPVHHSRESSTSRFSASLKNPGRHPHHHHHTSSSAAPWKKLSRHDSEAAGDDTDDDNDGYGDSGRNIRLYFCFFLLFVTLFSMFSLILWGASKSYEPRVTVTNMVFWNLNVQSGNDGTGVPTDMLSLNSTVRISYRNPATFFGVHVISTPLQLNYYQLKLASGQMQKFYQHRKSQRKQVVVVLGHQIPLYGGVSVLGDTKQHMDSVALPLNLTFVVRSRAYILGRLVKSKFYTRIRCPVTLHGNKLGKPLHLVDSCFYN